MKSYLTVGRNASFRFTERKSVFIGNIFRTESYEAAAAAIAGVRDMYPDARHNVYAYILRQGNMSRYTDDGEPHGTAGMPVLQVLWTFVEEYPRRIAVRRLPAWIREQTLAYSLVFVFWCLQ